MIYVSDNIYLDTKSGLFYVYDDAKNLICTRSQYLDARNWLKAFRNNNNPYGCNNAPLFNRSNK